MRPLRELNQVTVAIVGSVVVAAVILTAVSFGHLPFIARVSTYHAEFADAAGLVTGDEVRVAGLNVGEVSAVELQGAHVGVTFTVKDYVHLGRDTALNIKIASLLGQEYLEVTPAGAGQLTADDVIPQSRTTSPFTLVELLGTLSTRTEQIDLGQLDTALRSLADDLRTTPAAARGVLDGLSRLSQTIASRRDKVSELIRSAQQVAGTLADRRSTLVALLGNADLVLQTLEQRRQVIHQLFVDAGRLGQQLTSVLHDNSAQLQPLLANLQTVTAVLSRDQGALDQSIQLLAPFARYFANAGGSGHYVDVTAPTLLLPDNVLVQCGKPGATDPTTGCRP
jgi:phospholipid/cholesterol/gamma-HCH transport system substrate-binding protein